MNRTLVSLVLSSSAAVMLTAGCSSAPGSDPNASGDEEEALSVGMTQVLAWAHQAGIACDSRLVTAGAIAEAESGLDTTQVGTNGPTSGCPFGSRDRGLWQINDCYNPGVSDSCAFDPLCNARTMVAISSGGTNWGPWSSFNNGAYRAFLGRAQAAFNAVCASPGTCTAEETANAAKFGCACVDHHASGGFCEGTGCTAEETTNAGKFGCACVDHKGNGGFCPGSGCTARETEDAAKFGCACVDHQGNGGFCPGTGCTPRETEDAAKFGCACVDHKGSGGFCPGTGCTAGETHNCAAHGHGCSLHKCK